MDTVDAMDRSTATVDALDTATVDVIMQVLCPSSCRAHFSIHAMVLTMVLTTSQTGVASDAQPDRGRELLHRQG